MPKRYTNNVVMAWGDLHAPYEKKSALEFLADIKSTYNPDRVICLGDLLDMYSVSAYPKSMDHPDSWTDELKKGRTRITKLAKIFEELEVMSSNHDDRGYKKSRVAGIPREFLVKYRKVIGAPDTWNWHKDLRVTIDSTREQLFFAHTAASGCLPTAKSIGTTTVLGHQHTKFGAEAFKPTSKKTIWGVDAGSLVSDKGSPFSYNKVFRGRPITGCVILQDGVPILEPF